MTITNRTTVNLRHPDKLFIGGAWVDPSSSEVIEVIDAGTEEVFFSVPAAQAADVERAVAAAREAFDRGPWPRMTHVQRAEYLRALAAGLRERKADVSQIFPRESGAILLLAEHTTGGAARTFEEYAAMAETFPFEEPAKTTMGGGFGMIVREPVGVVGAIVPWNGPLPLLAYKTAPALIAGCTVVIKPAPEAPGEAYIVAEVAEQVGFPPGVINVIAAHREVSELLVRNPGIDKITFTGSTAAGRRIGSICGERVARCTLELGGKSAAVILDDADLGAAAAGIALAESMMAGQICASLTRVVVPRARHDEMVEALSATFATIRVGDPFDSDTFMGPLAMERQRDRVEGYIAKGIEEGATLASGGGRPKHLDRGWYIEPTVFADVDNSSTIAQEEIFGPVLCVIPADSEEHAIAIANDTIYGLNASVFTPDVNRARSVAAELRSGTVGHNGFRPDFGIAFGGFKQSGIGREGGREGLFPFLETKTLVLESAPAGYEDAS